MSRLGSGVDVCLDSLDRPGTPHCPHGPTLLFERFALGEVGGRRFFACSACRDRRECSFFQWEDEKVSKQKQRSREIANLQHQPPFTHKQYYKRYLQFKKLPPEKRMMCQDCHLLLLPDEWQVHKGHKIIEKITKKQLHRPSIVLNPLDNNRMNAQFLFSQKSLDFIVRTLEDLGFKRIICMGTPRLHEALNKRKKNKNKRPIESLLLDIDHRLLQFYNTRKMCRYNMFNHHFFDGSRSSKFYKSFLGGEDGEKVALITDPPFGGLVEVLSHTVKKIMSDWHEQHPGMQDGVEIPVIWFFPYFMEPRIIQCLPSFTMMDYKVEYDNHTTFNNTANGSRHGSPVRIFTNIDPSKVVLPIEEGYRFCEPCKRYVANENRHCEKCRACTSKDGRQYVHCDKCERCVKPSRVHCEKCETCQLPNHDCFKPQTVGCHICGELSHKRKDCPSRITNRQQALPQQQSHQRTDHLKKGKKRKSLSQEIGNSNDIKPKKKFLISEYDFEDSCSFTPSEQAKSRPKPRDKVQV